MVEIFGKKEEKEEEKHSYLFFSTLNLDYLKSLILPSCLDVHFTILTNTG